MCGVIASKIISYLSQIINQIRIRMIQTSSSLSQKKTDDIWEQNDNVNNVIQTFPIKQIEDDFEIEYDFEIEDDFEIVDSMDIMI